MTTTYSSSALIGEDERNPLTEKEFCNFYEAHAEALRCYIIRVTGNISKGEDIFQETCYRLLRTSLPPMNLSQLRAYAYRAATRLIYDSWRQAGRLGGEVPGERIDRPRTPELRHDIEKLFSRLTARQRALLWLAYVEGCDHREIAERLGLRVHSIRVLLFRARRKFSRILTSEGLGLAISGLLGTEES